MKAMLGGRGPQMLVSGWQVSGTFFARTGFPYTVFDFAQSGVLAKNNYFSLLYAVPAGPLNSDLSCGAGAALPIVTRPCQVPQVLSNGINSKPERPFRASRLRDWL